MPLQSACIDSYPWTIRCFCFSVYEVTNIVSIIEFMLIFVVNLRLLKLLHLVQVPYGLFVIAEILQVMNGETIGVCKQLL